MKKHKATPKPANQNNTAPTVMVQNIVVRPTNRKTQDIGSWRRAMQAAEATVPRFVELYDLYTDLMLDGHLQSVVAKRIMAVTNAEWQFVNKDGEIIDSVNDLIDTPEFEETVTEILNSKIWGYSILEFTSFTPDGFNCHLIPRKHYRPHLGIVAFEQTGDNGINIREGLYLSTIMEVGKPKDLGLLLSAAQYVIYKRGGFGDWSQFAEIFGMPFRKGKYDGFDESQRVKLEEALENMGSAGYVVIPQGADIEFLENKNNADGRVYNFLIDACNKELSKLILGQTETTESSKSSGYAQSQTHAETEADIQKSDRKFVRRILNKYWLKKLEANGVKTQGGKFKIKGEGEEKVPKENRLKMHVSLVRDLNLPYDDNFFYKEYDMPKPADYDKQKAEKQKAAELAAQQPAPPVPNNKAPKKAKPANLSADGEEIASKIEEASASFIKRITGFFG